MDQGPGDKLIAVVLAALEEGPAHGYLIARRTRTWSGGDLRLREGSLYPLLHGMEQAGLVTAKTEHQGERTRRVYQLTVMGAVRLAEEREGFLRQVQIMRQVLWRGKTETYERI